MNCSLQALVQVPSHFFEFVCCCTVALHRGRAKRCHAATCVAGSHGRWPSLMMATLPQLMAHLLPLFMCFFSISIIHFCRMAWPTSDKNLRASAQPVLPTPQQHRRSSGSDRSDSLLWGYHGNTMAIYPLVNKHSY